MQRYTARLRFRTGVCSATAHLDIQTLVLGAGRSLDLEDRPPHLLTPAQLTPAHERVVLVGARVSPGRNRALRRVRDIPDNL